MITSAFSKLFILSTFLGVIAVPLVANAGDPLPLEIFNADVFKLSTGATRKILDRQGENDARCDDMMVTVTSAVFRCLREKEKCEVQTASDGSLIVPCAADSNECDAVALTTAEDFWAANGGCKEAKVRVTSPGCGNAIAEFGEDCDLGVDNGTPNAACSDKCKALGVAAAPAPQADAGAAPVGAPPQAGNNATGGCALHSFATNEIPLWHLLALAIVLAAGWRNRSRLPQ